MSDWFDYCDVLKKKATQILENYDKSFYSNVLNWNDFRGKEIVDISIDLNVVIQLDIQPINTNGETELNLYLPNRVTTLKIPKTIINDDDGKDVVEYIWKCWMKCHDYNNPIFNIQDGSI